MTVPENICPVCKNTNELEAVVCLSCGAALEDPYMDPGARTKATDSLEHAAGGLKGFFVDEATIPHKGIAIYVEGLSSPAYIDTKGEFVIGRMADRTSGIAEVLLDLSPFGGYGLGISRRAKSGDRYRHTYHLSSIFSIAVIHVFSAWCCFWLWIYRTTEARLRSIDEAQQASGSNPDACSFLLTNKQND